MMVTDSRYDDLERRLRTAESDIVGDRHVSHYAAEQARRGTEAFLGLRAEVATLRVDIASTMARVDAIGENVAAINTMLVRHGRAIEVLQQDVRELRQEQIAMRGEMNEMRSEMGEMRGKMGEMRSDMSEMRGGMGEMRGGMGEMRSDMNEMRGGMNEMRGEMNRKLDLLVAAIAPPRPA
jgi:chromosome segregation ATPase